MGRPNCVGTDNGGGFITCDCVDCCDSTGILRECTASGKRQQNSVVENEIWRAMKGDHAARRKIRRLFPVVESPKIPFIGGIGSHVWLECVLWTSSFVNRSATKANTGWRSPREVIFGRLPDLQMVPFVSSKHDAVGPEHQIRCPIGCVLSSQQRPQPLLVHHEFPQELKGVCVLR